MKSRLMPVAKMTRHSDTSVAREKLLFGRLGSTGESVRFVLFPILIDAFLLYRSGKPQSTQPSSHSLKAVLNSPRGGDRGQPLSCLLMETAALFPVALKERY